MHEEGEWPGRPWILGTVGALTGFGLYLLGVDQLQTSPGRASAAAFLFTFALLLGFTLERTRWRWALLFALAGGAVAAGLLWWNGGVRLLEGPERWRLPSAAVALFIAAPLFQTLRDSGGGALPYRAMFGHGWANVMLWCLGWAFTGIAWLLALLLAALFNLIGIDAFSDLLRRGWFAATLTGGAFGSALGLLREQAGIVALLQRAALTVLRILAPVLAAGLLIFLLALPFTGLAPLWQATKATTPILLSCVVGGLILANAVIGAAPEEEARPRPLRWGAAGLAAALLPLALIAAVSLGLRIAQHGLTPERLWALVGVVVASAFGLAYLVALVRGRGDWAAYARPANRALALGLLGAATLLATPMIGFSALSTRDQLARLEIGRITPDRFDWGALAFDFGPPGRRALERLARTGPPPIRDRARRALAAKDRWSLGETTRASQEKHHFADRVVILPRPTDVPDELVALVTRNGQCGGEANGARCILRYEAGATEAVLVQNPTQCVECEPLVQPFLRHADGGWGEAYRDTVTVSPEAAERKARAARLAEAARQGRIEVREVPRRQVFVGDTPLGPVFE